MTGTTEDRQPVRRRSARYLARQALRGLIDVVFPPRCGGCNRRGVSWCAACRASVTYLPADICPRCGYPHPGHRPTPPCPQCTWLNHTGRLGLRSASVFAGPVRQALHRLKYKQDTLLADALAYLLYDTWRQQALGPGIVLPIPLSAERSRERGYNQAGLLAQAFADQAGLAYHPDGLHRQRHTRSQVGLSAAERRDNVQGAFVGAPQRVAGQAVLLVDDVCTTGATLVAGAEALLAAGATQVWGLTLARAL